MPDSVVQAVTSKIEMPATERPAPAAAAVARTPNISRARALGNFAARNIVGSVFGYDSGIYDATSRLAPRRNMVERLVPVAEQARPERVLSQAQPTTSGPQRVGGILRGNAVQDARIAADISSMSKDMSDLKDNSRRTLRDIGIVKDSVLRIEKLISFQRDERPNKNSSTREGSSWLAGLAAAGGLLLSAFSALTAAVSGLAALLGNAIVGAITSLFSATGAVGRALITGAQFLFSGPALAGIIGAGALAAIGTAIVRAMNMTPEEREAARTRAEEQAQTGRESNQASPASNPGRAYAGIIQRRYDVSSPEYGDIEDILMTPRPGENQEQRSERERLSELQRQAGRNSRDGNVQLAPGVADFVATARAENAERDIEAGTAENRAAIQSISPDTGFGRVSEEEAQAQGMPPRSAVRVQPRSSNPDNATVEAQRMMPLNEREVSLSRAFRSVEPRTASLIENYAAMRGIRNPAGGVLEDGKVVAVLDSNRRRIDVTDISRRDYSNVLENDASGTLQQPELVPTVNDNRAQTISQNANQPSTTIINNQAPPPAAAAPVAMQGQQGGGGGLMGRARARAAALPAHPIRPGEAGSPAVSR
jgi:hypothetical protein